MDKDPPTLETEMLWIKFILPPDNYEKYKDFIRLMIRYPKTSFMDIPEIKEMNLTREQLIEYRDELEYIVKRSNRYKWKLKLFKACYFIYKDALAIGFICMFYSFAYDLFLVGISLKTYFLGLAFALIGYAFVRHIEMIYKRKR